MSYLFSFFLVLSGIASLTYQVTWVRLLGLSMGSTSASVSTVLAAFFLGMALGSYSAERITRNRVDRLTPYLILEVLIGGFGLLLLPILLNLDAVMALAPEFGGTLSAKFMVAVVLLTIPAMCMGATFPVMAALLIRRQGEVGLRLGQLYSLNTLGAVLGACLSGFLFIPMFGIDGAIYIAASLNATIVVIGVLANGRLVLPPLESDFVQRSKEARPAPFRRRALIVLFFTGFVSIAAEVGWTKYLSIFTGTTIYGFASILTMFLIGIAAGSWAIHRYLARIRRPELWMAVGLLLLGGSLLLTRGGLSIVPNLYTSINYLEAPDFIVHGVKYAFVFLLLIIPTFLLGALFPLNLTMYCGGIQGVRTRVGRAYAINTLASILGSVAAGFWLIPEYGTDLLLTGTALIILALPFLFIPALNSRPTQALVAAAVGIMIGGNWIFPHLDYQALIASVGYQYDVDVRQGKKPDFVFLKEGKAGVISVVSYDGQTAKLQSNGLNESVVDLEDRTHGLIVEQLLGLVPYFLHDNPRTAFIVGFGGGVTTRALTLTDLEAIRVVELEPAVIEAGRAIAKGDIPELKDPRVRLDYNDARNTLLLDQTHYDIIVSQPSHSWLAGAANVFTKEFFEIAKSRLNDGGIYGQWVNLFNMDATTLRAILKAFYEVFPQGVSFANISTGDFLMFGTDHSLVFDYEKITARMQRPAIQTALKHYGIEAAEDLIWYFGLSRREIMEATRDSLMNQDTNILSEVRLSALVAPPVGDESPYNFLEEKFKFDLAPYLKPEEAAQRIYDAGLYFLRWDAPWVTRKAADQLRTRDEVLARALDYELLWTEERWDQAAELYAKHDAWLDRVHYLAMQAAAEQERFDEARQAVQRIRDVRQRRVASAQLFYLRKDWKALAALSPQSNEERKWQLLGAARRDLKIAGQQLLALDTVVDEDPPLLRVLVEYFSVEHNTSEMEKYARLLVQARDKQSSRLAQLARKAIEERAIQRAHHLLTKIESINPATQDLLQLRRDLSKIEESKEVAAPASHS